MVRLLAFGVVVAGLTAPRASFATEPQPGAAFSFEFRAPAGCPTRADFERALLSRSPDARAIEPVPGTLALDVALARDGETFSGVLGITLPDATHSERSVSNASCEEAVLSLAVIASLVLDAYRSEPPPRSEPAPAGEPSNAIAPQPALAPSAAARVASTPAAAIRDENEPQHDHERSRGAAFPLNFGLFAAATLETAVAPTPPLGVLAGFEARWLRAAPWSPSARLGFLYTASDRSASGAGSAEFRLVATRLTACPARFGQATGVALQLCLDLDAGALRGGEASAPNARVRWMPWLALGLALRGEFPLFTFVSLDAFAGVRALARHDRFVLAARDDPARSAVLYDVPSLSLGAGLGLTVRLP